MFKFCVFTLCQNHVYCIFLYPLICSYCKPASGSSLSGVLNVCKNGEQLPVAYYFRQLRGAEKRYSATELECLAVVSSIRHFEVYIHVK